MSGPCQKSLPDLIGIIFHRDTYSQLIDHVSKGKTLDDIAPIANDEAARIHRGKILHEEIEMQFSHAYRPVIELILNSADARSQEHDGPYVIETRANGRHITIEDQGKGMGLEHILTTLVVPFKSDKDALKDIGRFGIGFFSSLNYCLRHPKKGKVSITTTDGDAAYTLSFCSATGDIEDLMTTFTTSRRKKGTKVDIRYPHKKKELVSYVARQLGFFDDERAKICMNRKELNASGSNPSERRSKPYLGNMEIPRKGEEIGIDTGDARVRITSADEGEVRLYSQGVFVRSAKGDMHRIDIDFPAHVSLVEGRDDFKNDTRYEQAYESILKEICAHASTSLNGHINRPALADALARVAWTSNIKTSKLQGSIRDHIQYLFPEDIYLLEGKRCNSIYDAKAFFGASIRQHLYEPRSRDGFHFWRDILPSMRRCMETHTSEPEEGDNSLYKLPALGSLLPTIESIDKSMRDLECAPVKVLTDDEKIEPFYLLDKDLFVNVDHPILHDSSFIGEYAARTSLMRLIQGEHSAENLTIGGYRWEA